MMDVDVPFWRGQPSSQPANQRAKLCNETKPDEIGREEKQLKDSALLQRAYETPLTGYSTISLSQVDRWSETRGCVV